MFKDATPKSVVYLSIILCGYLLLGVVPFQAMFGFGATVFFSAFFLPYFGKKNTVKILCVLTSLTLVVSGVILYASISTMTSGIIHFGQATVQAAFNHALSQNLTVSERSNITSFMASLPNSSAYRAMVFCASPVFIVPMIVGFPYVINIGLMLYAHRVLKKIGVYKRIQL